MLINIERRDRVARLGYQIIIYQVHGTPELFVQIYLRQLRRCTVYKSRRLGGLVNASCFLSFYLLYEKKFIIICFSIITKST